MPRHTHLTSRRDMLKVGLGSLPLIVMGGSVPLLASKFAFAQDKPATPIPKDNILVIVQLSGGNDGLNTVVPFKHDQYLKIRPRIALKERLHNLSDEYALNPGMTAFKRFFD